MSDPSGETDIELGIMGGYGSGRSALAPLTYPDGTEEWLPPARGDKRLVGKAWHRLRAWAAKTGVREGVAVLGPIFHGPHHAAEVRTLNADAVPVLRVVYGPKAGLRILRDEDERLLSDIAETHVCAEAQEVKAQEAMAWAEQALQQCAIAGDKAGQAELQEFIAQLKATQVEMDEAEADLEAATANLERARSRWTGMTARHSAY